MVLGILIWNINAQSSPKHINFSHPSSMFSIRICISWYFPLFHLYTSMKNLATCCQFKKLKKRILLILWIGTLQWFHLIIAAGLQHCTCFLQPELDSTSSVTYKLWNLIGIVRYPLPLQNFKFTDNLFISYATPHTMKIVTFKYLRNVLKWTCQLNIWCFKFQSAIWSPSKILHQKFPCQHQL